MAREIHMSSTEMDEMTTTGVEEIDREHAMELQIVRSIQAALTEGDNSHVGEQLLMRFHAYPGYEAHQEEHDHLMADLKELSERLLTQETTDSVREAENLERWLITHIQSEDQALAEYLKSRDNPA